jgi:hypothetical protein
MFIIVVILSNGLMKSLLNSVLDKDGGLYKEMCDILHLTNIVHQSTCFTKGASTNLNDVILTNKPNYCMNTTNC